jgi:hypothetical protein
MSHFAAVLGFIGRLYAIRHALTYDLRDDMPATSWPTARNCSLPMTWCSMT